jgi:L-glutamine:2-deoxy-scyllo-inosose/3-amino-2,3-dideoxy-scyllo-inosose aminotransferase
MRITDKRTALGVEPMLELTKGWTEHGQLEKDFLAEVVDSDLWFWENPVFAKFEPEFAALQGLPSGHAAISCSNGTDAIVLILKALDIGDGDEVIVPGLTWQATGHAVLEVNAVPVLLDVDPDTLALHPDRFEEYIKACIAYGSPLPKVIILVHLFDRAARMDRFVEICKEYGIFLIEDAAHAHGARWRETMVTSGAKVPGPRGRALGSFGVAASFSFEGTKVLPGGEGGMVTTGVPEIEARIRTLKHGGRRLDTAEIVSDSTAGWDPLTAYWRERVAELGLAVNVDYGQQPRPDRRDGPAQGGNNRMTPWSAAVLRAQMQRFPALHEERGRTLAELDDRMPSVGGIRPRLLQSELTAPVAYRFAFQFIPEAFAGMDAELFREVLGYLLGGHRVADVYDPLGGGEPGYRSPVYNPQTLRRYKLSDGHWAAIDPARWPLPECHRANRQGVSILHPFLREPGAADALIEAIGWMRDNADRVVELGD